MNEDGIGRIADFRHPRCTNLTQPDTMTPTGSMQDEMIELLLHDEG
jgi:hypothetical protein